MVRSGKKEEAVNAVSTPAPLPSSSKAELVTRGTGRPATSNAILLLSDPALLGVWAREDGANICSLMPQEVLNAVLREQRQGAGGYEMTNELQDHQLT